MRSTAQITKGGNFRLYLHVSCTTHCPPIVRFVKSKWGSGKDCGTFCPPTTLHGVGARTARALAAASVKAEGAAHWKHRAALTSNIPSAKGAARTHTREQERQTEAIGATTLSLFRTYVGPHLGGERHGLLEHGAAEVTEAVLARLRLIWNTQERAT